MPFALPYYPAVDQLLKANLSVESSLFVLATYNIGYALPFLLVSGLVVVMGATAKPILEKINTVLVNLVDTLMPVLLFLPGSGLSADGLSYLITGDALW